ncbi:unnamed protein product [Mytilus edulis]|uniref:Reverse transcriptase domain-containing protein n=1 Tax=Mytilus edulis TaxID=6550 RepID=A0A8S3QPQ6_MYTED|nr:unnamed protein product [Mytilus edulis]
MVDVQPKVQDEEDPMVDVQPKVQDEEDPMVDVQPKVQDEEDPMVDVQPKVQDEEDPMVDVQPKVQDEEVMPPTKKRNPTKRKSRFQPYSTEINVTNTNSEKTKSEMVDELSKIGFKVPPNLTLNVVKSLYTENIVNKSDDRAVETIETSLSPTEGFSSVNPTASTETQNIEHNSATENVNTNILVTAFNTMSQCVNGLQKSVDTLMTEKLYDSKPYNLHQWYNSSNTTPPLQNTPDALHQGLYRTGVRSDDFPNVDIVSSGLQKQIIQGKDINLASLLIPSFESPQSHTILADGMEINVGNKPDPRLNRQLTIQEFIKAFGKFKRVMTSAFPGRRFELDAYEEDIIEISNFYGNKFYDYHKLFSAKASTLLQEKQIKVDWSKRDRDLMILIGAGVEINICKLCHMVDHDTKFCPLQLAEKSVSTPHLTKNSGNSDIRGRKRFYHNGKEICNNFNSLSGCNKDGRCLFLHMCSNCRNYDHSATTPINVEVLQNELRNHSDKSFVYYLCNGLKYGFDTKVSVTSLPTLECRNNLSARSQPNVVNELLRKECENGFMYGPFDTLPFSSYRVSPLGVAEGKYSKKKRLILDLSAPHQSDIHFSINELIDKDTCSMSYVKIDNAIDIILKYGRHSWLCKYDISNAFKNCPILPSQWPLFCIKWEDKYYFYVRLTFGCRSSPIIFDTLSQAICYIATNNYKVNNILHLLDDFLTIDPPHAEGERSMALMMMIFKRLNVPIAMHKTVGPVTCLEYLGIILDSEKMEARLPQEKVDRICEFISSISVKSSCSKREVLQLLGHLNFASRVILPGSYDMELYTDASSTIGFGGYFGGKWFYSSWPTEIKNITNSKHSMAFFELYPIVVAAVLWGASWKTKKVLFWSDNMSTVEIIRKGRSKCLYIMKLMRKLTWCAYTTFQNPGTRCRHFSGTVSQNLRCNMVLKQTVEQLWTTSISKRTKDAYDIGFMHFKRYLLLNNVTFTNNLAPVSEEILIYFVAHCQTVLKLHYSTIKLYLCGIRYNYLKENCSDPLELYNGKPLPRLTLILNSVKRSQNQNKRIRLPITFDILEQIIKRLRKGVFSKFIDLMIETASVISFFGFLRCGEITVIKSEHFEPAINLCISDISFTDNIANLHLKQSKTDPFRHSFRIGAGTAAGQAKIEDHMIKTLGRWSSDCYVRYIRTQPISIKHAQQQLAESFNH